jgi:hypothetical protein
MENGTVFTSNLKYMANICKSFKIVNVNFKL